VAPLADVVLEKAQGAARASPRPSTSPPSTWQCRRRLARRRSHRPWPRPGFAALGRSPVAGRGPWRCRCAAPRQKWRAIGTGRCLPRRCGVIATPKIPTPKPRHEPNRRDRCDQQQRSGSLCHPCQCGQAFEARSARLAASLMFGPATAGEKPAWVGTWLASPQPTMGRRFCLAGEDTTAA